MEPWAMQAVTGAAAVIGGSLVTGVALILSQRNQMAHEREVRKSQHQHDLHLRVFDYEYDRLRRIEVALLTVGQGLLTEPATHPELQRLQQQTLQDAFRLIYESEGYLSRYSALHHALLDWMAVAAQHYKPESHEGPQLVVGTPEHDEAVRTMQEALRRYRGEFDRLLRGGFLLPVEGDNGN